VHRTDARTLAKHFGLPLGWPKARVTPRRVQNYILAQQEHQRGEAVLQSLPIKLTVESTNLCNLRCPACPTGTGSSGRAKGHLGLELFGWLLGELGPTLLEVELHNWGEPLLGKSFVSAVKLASEAGVATTASSNLSIPLDEERAESIVESGLSTLGVSIDGATQGTYEQYRVRGDLALVLRNCRLITDAKRRLGSFTPELYMSYHVFPHNLHEVEAARALAGELGMTLAVTRGWVLGQEAEGTAQYRYGWGEGFPDRCFFLWFQAVVHHDGGVAPCCGTFHEGDDFTRLRGSGEPAGSFRDVWNGPSFVAARRLFASREGDEATRKLACFDCPETKDFERWKVALRTHDPTFRRTSSNVMYNHFFERARDGSAVVPLRRRP
jgi:MoaA/NifB/PqqE/SkfB family radical SAM enzyme